MCPLISHFRLTILNSIYYPHTVHCKTGTHTKTIHLLQLYRTTYTQFHKLKIRKYAPSIEVSKSQAQCQHFAFHNLTSKHTSYRPHILHSYNSSFPALTEFKGILNSKRICQLEPSSTPPPNAHSPTFPSTAASYSLRDELPMSSILENKSQTITFQQRLKPND